jgi:hypothetical protein
VLAPKEIDAMDGSVDRFAAAVAAAPVMPPPAARLL